jgi:glycosyltransferase involved in cell wall biosynthesis
MLIGKLLRICQLGPHSGKSSRFLRDVRASRRRYGELVRLVKSEDSAKERDRWLNMAEEHPRLTFVVVTYQQESALDCLLKSLICQTLQNFNVLVIHDGPSPGTRAIVSAYPKNFEYFETENRFNDFGHSLRQIGIDKTNTEFILLTNGDNYYAPRFTEFMFEAIDRQGLDLVFCDIVHSHVNPGESTQPSYSFFRTRPFRLCIDIGCFIARSALAKKVGFRDRSFEGDATYFEGLLKTGRVTVGKVDKVLMVHN